MAIGGSGEDVVKRDEGEFSDQLSAGRAACAGGGWEIEALLGMVRFAEWKNGIVEFSLEQWWRELGEKQARLQKSERQHLRMLSSIGGDHNPLHQ